MDKNTTDCHKIKDSTTLIVKTLSLGTLYKVQQFFKKKNLLRLQIATCCKVFKVLLQTCISNNTKV